LSETADPDDFATVEGEPVFQATIRSPAGAVANVLSWGAVIKDLQIPLV
jgi:aldose 1-epimerase